MFVGAFIASDCHLRRTPANGRTDKHLRHWKYVGAALQKYSCLMTARGGSGRPGTRLDNRKVKSNDREYRSEKTIDYRCQGFSSVLNWLFSPRVTDEPDRTAAGTAR
jgi:hypothetical protein